jgi:aryl-alcohol dehydrogenase-like predicted oxidoreductase
MPTTESHLMDKGIDRLGFGSAGITSMRSYGAVRRLLDLAFASGITHFDTAPLYGQGYSEKIMGAFLKNKRDKVTIATKFGLGLTPDLRIPFRLALPLNYYRKRLRGKVFTPGGEEVALSYRNIPLAQIKASLGNSLRSLNTDYIDYYFVHEGLPSFLDAEALAFLLEQKKKGIIKFLGIATGSMNLRQLQKSDLIGWDVLQYESGPFSNSSDIQLMFPEKLHFFHSSLKHLARFDPPGVLPENKAGFILAEQVKANSNGKVLFSTRRKTSLESNLDSFKHYYK